MLGPRPTLQEHLLAQGQPVPVSHPCENMCRRERAPAQLVDAAMYPDLWGRWVCEVCISCKDREEQAMLEAQRPWPTEEDLAGLRAERDLRLTKTDWTQLLDNRDRLGPVNCDRYDLYRAEVRAVVTFAKLGARRDWPPPVVEEPTTGAED